MTDVDERGQDRPRIDLSEGQIVQRLRCGHCTHVIKITRKYRQTLARLLDPNMPARTVTVDCPKCGRFQFILRLKTVYDR